MRAFLPTHRFPLWVRPQSPLLCILYVLTIQKCDDEPNWYRLVWEKANENHRNHQWKDWLIDWEKEKDQNEWNGAGWAVLSRCNRVFEWQYRSRGVTRSYMQTHRKCGLEKDQSHVAVINLSTFPRQKGTYLLVLYLLEYLCNY